MFGVLDISLSFMMLFYSSHPSCNCFVAFGLVNEFVSHLIKYEGSPSVCGWT